jgi:hypothetical protein
MKNDFPFHFSSVVFFNFFHQSTVDHGASFNDDDGDHNDNQQTSAGGAVDVYEEGCDGPPGVEPMEEEQGDHRRRSSITHSVRDSSHFHTTRAYCW